MLNPLLAYTVDFSLQPTPAQATALLQLSAASRMAELLARDLAVLALAGQDVALATLAGGLNHPDRSLAGEAVALAETPCFRDVRRVRWCMRPPPMPRVSSSAPCATSAISPLRVAGGDDVVQPASHIKFEINGAHIDAVDLAYAPEWA